MVHGLIILHQKLKDLVDKKCNIADFSDLIDKFVNDGGNLNESIIYRDDNPFVDPIPFIYYNMELLSKEPEALKLFIDKGADLKRYFLIHAISNKYYNLVPILLNGLTITKEYQNWIKAKSQKHISLEELDKAFEKVHIRKDYVEKAIKMIVDVHPDSVEVARTGMCFALYSLSTDVRDGITTNFKVIPYLLHNEIDMAQKYKVSHDDYIRYIRNPNLTLETIVSDKKILKDPIKVKQAEQVLDIVNRVLDDMAYCLGSNKGEIHVSLRSQTIDNDQYEGWHRDPRSYNENFFRVTLAIKGDGTMFAYSSDNIEQKKLIQNEDSVKDYSTSPAGALSIFYVSNEETGVVHKAPIVTDSRVVVVFDCIGCLTEITHQNLIQKVTEFNLYRDLEEFNGSCQLKFDLTSTMLNGEEGIIF